MAGPNDGGGHPVDSEDFPETASQRRRRARRMIQALAQTYPDARWELDFSTPLELAVATILSARSTDAKINEITSALFARYRTADDYARADRDERESLIRSSGFFHNKATSLMRFGAALAERFDGEVPDALDALVSLPGVGRKTANVILGNAFGVPNQVSRAARCLCCRSFAALASHRTPRAPFDARGSPVIYAVFATGVPWWMMSWQGRQTMRVLRRILAMRVAHGGWPGPVGSWASLRIWCTCTLSGSWQSSHLPRRSRVMSSLRV